MAARLQEVGIREVRGVDIIPEARAAARRDRPDAYRSYHVADISSLPPDAAEELRSAQLNCLTCVAALGFHDIPTNAFVAGLRLLSTGGLVAFNIKETFLDMQGSSPFAALIERLIRERVLRLEATAGTCTACRWPASP